MFDFLKGERYRTMSHVAQLCEIIFHHELLEMLLNKKMLD